MAWKIFGVQNFEIQYFGGFQKNENIFGYEEIVDIFGVITLLDWFVGSFLYILGPFLKARYRMGIFLGVTKNSNIHYGMPDIADIFIGLTVDAGSKPTYAEEIESPPHHPWAETIHGRNDSRPKRPIKIGRIDSPQNSAEMTGPKRPIFGRNDPRLKRLMSETTHG